MATVSVVIPARDSQETIRVTVQSLWKQTRHPDEVLIVVGHNDFTRTAIEEFVASGFVKIVVVGAPQEYVRDAQWKRWYGAKVSTGDLIFFTDSKVVVDPRAIENSLRLMDECNVSVVGGITPAWPDQCKNFWAKLHDHALVSNLPNFPPVGFLTRENFGKSESLPVTTALMMTRAVFEVVQDDFALDFSKIASTYDDYVLAWLIVNAGFSIVVTDQVIVHHKHRVTWGDYSKQIARSGQSAAIMAKMYPGCPFGVRRVKQVRFIGLVLSFSALLGVVGVCMFERIAVVAGLLAVLVGYCVLGIVNTIKAKETEAFLFPLFTILLVLNFALHFTKTYIQPNHNSEEVVQYLQIH